MSKKIFLFLLLIPACGFVFSQTTEPPDYTQGVKLYKEKKYTEALPFLLKSISQFTAAANRDNYKLATAHHYTGYCYYLKSNYNEALNNFFKSKDLFYSLNDLEKTFSVLKDITATYENAREDNVRLKSVAFDSTDAGEVYFAITAVNSLTKDSAFVTINEGKQDGLFLGSEGNMVSSYAVGNVPGREANEFLGKAKIIELTDYSAKAVVHFYKDYKGVQIYPKDLLTLKAYPVIGAQKSIFFEMARLNVLFLDNSREEIVSKKAILLNTDPALENMLLKLYAKQITDFYDDIKGYDTLATFTTPYKKGRFKGYTLIDAFKITTHYDLNSFFNFVKNFPGKYMGTSWKINETYATWVLNDAIQGGSNMTWLLPIIEHTNISELDSLLYKTSYYITSDTLHQWTNRLTELQAGNNLEEAEQLSNKLLYIAKRLKDSHAENEFYYSRSFIKDAQGKKKEAIRDAVRAYNADKSSINYMYGLASFYGKNENFDSAFALYDKLQKLLPGNVNVTGNYGWYKLVAGQLDEAIRLCREAYYGEPGNVAFSVNYGHTFLLKGNMDSAKYYYSKMLESLVKPADYYDGPKKDFEIFFTKGWQRKNVGEVADWLDNEFNEKYFAITTGNTVWDEAKKYYDAAKYKLAIKEWHRYISLFDKVKDPPYSSIHNAYNWIGSSYDNINLPDSTIKYYEIAHQMALQHLVKERNEYTTRDNDLIVGNYNRFYNFYTKIKNKPKAEEYKALYDAEAHKVTELYTTPQLYFTCMGGTMAIDELSNQSNAKLLFENFSKLRSSPDTSNSSKLLNGAALSKDKLLKSLEQIRQQSRPEDIFIFYYSGNTIHDKEESFLSFNHKDTVNGRISVTELMNNIDLIYAQKKMIIMDKPNPQLLSIITAKYTTAINSSSEVIFVCPGIETPVQKNNCSLFTNELVNTLNELQKKDKFSAKDFIDKASYTIGRGQYYLPVLSFTSGKDFLVFENKTSATDSTASQLATRGLKVNDNNSSTADAAAGGEQKNYALLFATDNYDNAAEFPKLINPIYDATTIADMLKENFNFTTELIKNPTLDEIENKLSEYRDKKFGPNDQLFIFFAGHGIYYEKARMGYLAAKDSRLNDPNKKTYLSYNVLGTIFLRNINCKRIFLVLDACFAGSFFDQSTVRGTPQEVDAKNLLSLKSMTKNKAFNKGISSGGHEYVADGKAGQHSPFASSFISKLWNTALNKNFVTADEIIGELKSHPPAATGVCEGNFQYSDPQAHFIFEKKSTEKTSGIKEDNNTKTFGNK